MAEILFQEGEAASINELPFPNCHKGKRQILMASHADRDVEGDVAMQPEGKLGLDSMAQ